LHREAQETSANWETSLLERQIQILGNTGERFWGLIIECIRTFLEARIAQERGEHVERTAGYSNDDDALRWEFRIDLEPEVSELMAGGHANLGRQQGQWEPQRNQGLDLRAVVEVDTPLQVRGTGLENKEENCFINTL